MADLWANTTDGITAPASGARAIVPSNTADYSTDAGAKVFRALYIGTGGDVRVLTVENEDVTFVGATGIIPVRVKRVFATNTTATNIVGLY